MEKRGEKVDKRKKVKLSDGTETTLATEKKRSSNATGKITTEVEVGKGLAEDLSKQEAALKSFESTVLKAEGTIAGLRVRLEECKKTVGDLEQEFNSKSTEKLKAAYEELRKEAEKLGIDLSDIPLEYTAENVQLLSDRVESFISTNMSQATEVVNKFGNTVQEVGGKLAHVS
jgi:hypothetical protein